MFTDEGRRLAAHWDELSSTELDRYLIQEVEHPAYNPQSVLMRAFLMDRLFPDQANDLIEEELYYAACACFALKGQREGWFREFYHSLRTSLENEALPVFLQDHWRTKHGGRFDLMDLYSELAVGLALGFDSFESHFQQAWQDWLCRRQLSPQPCKVLELGCGSANDYRCLHDFGMAKYLDYTGIDVSSKNIANAKTRFPDVNFAVGDACTLGFEDESFDLVCAFDLYEHLSPSGLEKALSETLRVAKDEVWISFFNAEDRTAHQFEEVEDYHWNLLSLGQLGASIDRAGFEVESISVSYELERRFPDYGHYNSEAYLLTATRT